MRAGSIRAPASRPKTWRRPAVETAPGVSEGAWFETDQTVTTGADGTAGFTQDLGPTSSIQPVVTATASPQPSAGTPGQFTNTSEFSNALALPGTNPPLALQPTTLAFDVSPPYAVVGQRVVLTAQVENARIPINPLGLTITYFREDQAFVNGD